jgi:hypothetical protein
VVWLTSQSLGLLVPACLALALLVAVSSRLAIRALIPDSERDAAHAVAAPLMPALGATFAILMALTLASEAGSFTSAQQIVSNEAADASRVAWAATSPGVQRHPVQTALGGYLLAARRYEWHGANAANGNDPATAHAISKLQRVVRAQAARTTLGTPSSSELLGAVDALVSDRRARLAAASHEPPGLYVITLVVSGVALIANASALTIRKKRRVAVLIGGLTIVIGLSIALLFALGTPWRGPMVVSGHPIDAVIHDLATGYFRP